MGITQRLGLTRYEADEYYAMALDFFEKGKLDDAIDHVGYAIALFNANPEYHAARGLFYHEDGITDEARKNYEQALKMHPAEVLANYGMGRLAYEKKDWAAALQWFNKVRTVNPMQIEAPYYMALIYHRQQDNQTAKVYMEQALGLMEDAGDKRKVDARRWVREFEKLIKQQKNEAEKPPPTQQSLPIMGDEAGVTVTPPEVASSPARGQLGTGEVEPNDADTDETNEADNA